MAGWTLDDIPWQAFDRARVDPAMIPVIKAASMVEARESVRGSRAGEFVARCMVETGTHTH